MLAAQARPTTSRPAEELYKANCVMCHMPDGNAAIPNMNFADGKWLHGSTPAQLAKVITNGVPGTAMMAFKERFSDAEIAGAREVRDGLRQDAQGAGGQEAGCQAGHQLASLPTSAARPRSSLAGQPTDGTAERGV